MLQRRFDLHNREAAKARFGCCEAIRLNVRVATAVFNHGSKLQQARDR